MRALALSNLAGGVARGLFTAAGTLYAIKIVGLSSLQVGTGLTLAASVGMLAGIPVGRWADRAGPRGVTSLSLALSGVSVVGYLFVSGVAEFALVAGFYSMCTSAYGSAGGALIAGTVPPGERVHLRAYLRSTVNFGWAVGAGLAGIGISAGSRTAYATLIGGACACFLLGGLLLMGCPRVVPAEPPRAEGRWTALRDRQYLALTGLGGVLCLSYALVNVGLPLYLAAKTASPLVAVSIASVLNTVAVILFQVRIGRRSAGVRDAARAQRTSGVVLLACCVVFALAQGRSPDVALTLVLAGACVHVVGEMLQAAGSWGISFGLAPDTMQGQYQGVYGLGYQVANIAFPLFAAALLAHWGWPGWIVLGAAFLLAGLAVPVVAERAVNSRAGAADQAGGLRTGTAVAVPDN